MSVPKSSGLHWLLIAICFSTGGSRGPWGRPLPFVGKVWLIILRITGLDWLEWPLLGQSVPPPLQKVLDPPNFLHYKFFAFHNWIVLHCAITESIIAFDMGSFHCWWWPVFVHIFILMSLWVVQLSHWCDRLYFMKTTWNQSL